MSPVEQLKFRSLNEWFDVIDKVDETILSKDNSIVRRDRELIGKKTGVRGHVRVLVYGAEIGRLVDDIIIASDEFSIPLVKTSNKENSDVYASTHMFHPREYVSSYKLEDVAELFYIMEFKSALENKSADSATAHITFFASAGFHSWLPKSNIPMMRAVSDLGRYFLNNNITSFIHSGVYSGWTNNHHNIKSPF